MRYSVAVRLISLPWTLTRWRAGSRAEPTRAEHGGVDAARPALQCAYPGQQLAEVEWLDQIVVRARVEAPDPVGRRVPRREHQQGGWSVVLARPVDHRRFPPRRACASR